MNTQEHEAPEPFSFRLPPFDPRTVAIGVWQRKYLVLLILAASIVLGLLAGNAVGTNVYEAETVISYNPPKEKPLDPLAIVVYITSDANLAELKRRLNLSASVPDLQKILSARPKEVSRTVFVIRAAAPSGKEAATLANTLRDIFIQDSVAMQKVEMEKTVRALVSRQAEVKAGLDKSSRELQIFMAKHRITGSDELARQGKVLLDAEEAYEKAVMDLKAVTEQTANLNHVVDTLRHKVEEEQRKGESMAQGDVAAIEGIQNVNHRVNMLRRSIEQAEKDRVNAVELAEKKYALEQAKGNLERGIITRREYDAAYWAYRRQVALVDSDRSTRRLKMEVDALTATQVPKAGQSTGTVFSAPILQQMLAKAFDLEVERVSLTHQVEHLRAVRDAARSRQSELTSLQPEYNGLAHAVSSQQELLSSLADQVSNANRSASSMVADFDTVEQAAVPTEPRRSTRQALPLQIAFLGIFFGTVLVLGLEIMDTRIKSGRDVGVKLGLPLIAALPRLAPEDQPFPGKLETSLVEPFSIVARRIRHHFPDPGARVLFVSARHGEGKTWILGNVASCFARQGEKVLLVETQTRREDEYALCDLLKDKPARSLSTYLTTDDKMSDIVGPTILRGVDCLPQAEGQVTADLLASTRMSDLLRETSTTYEMVLIDGPPVLEDIAAEFLAQKSDAVVLVVRAKAVRAEVLKKAIDHLQAANVSIIGVILNATDPDYLESA